MLVAGGLAASNCSSFCPGTSILQGLGVVGAVALVDITVVAYIDRDNKARVEEIFQGRRRSLPLELAPGATVNASFFFPVTTRPKRLALHWRSGDQGFESALELNASIR